MSAGAPRVLAVLPGLIPSTLISVVKPLSALHRAGRLTLQVALESRVTEAELRQADVVVLCRNTEPRFAFLLAALQRLGLPYIYDLDDNFFAIPPNSEEGRYHREPARLRLLEQYLARAALVRLYSEPLRRRVLQFTDRIELVAGSLDWRLIPAQAPPRAPGPVRVVYVTSRQEDELSRLFVRAATGLLARRAGQVEVLCWGFLPPELRRRPGVRYLAPVPDYDRFLGRLARSGFDIGLAPLLDDEFHRSKTNNKFREYGACRIAGIYSNVEVYAACVEDGRTGLLVPNTAEAWQAALERLVDDDGLRGRIQEAAQQTVRRHYSQELVQETWLRQLRAVLDGRPALRPAAPLPGAGVPAPESAHRLRWAAGMAAKLARRIRALGLRPALLTVYRYVYSLFLLRRIRRELARTAGASPPAP